MAPTGGPPTGQARFVGPAERADVAVLVVTYQSEREIGRLIGSLRSEAVSHRLRVVVADNASTDGTVQRLAAHQDVSIVEVGGNLGYAAGVNAAARLLESGLPRLVLNPDLEVRPGCIAALLHRMEKASASVVVPRIIGKDGTAYPSLHREPSLLGALGDAILGSRLPDRSAKLSENLLSPASYLRAQPVDWASGAALLIAPGVDARVGEWDESFFLYSEETDFLRRVRDRGGVVWYEPNATVQHDKGGSGSSVALDALRTVNRIRYVRKHRNRTYAAAYRWLVVLHEVMRSYQSSHRAILRTVLAENLWNFLPGPSPATAQGSAGPRS